MARNKSNSRQKEVNFQVEGLDCASCAGKIEKGLKVLNGVGDVRVSIGAGKVAVWYHPNFVTPKKIEHRLKELGYPSRASESEKYRQKSSQADLARLFFFTTLAILSWSGWLKPLLPFDVAILGVIIGGLPIFREGWLSLKARDITVETFMSLAIIAALIVQEYLASLVIVFFMLIAEVLEKYTTEKARKSIKDLLEVAPKQARVKRGGQTVEVSIDQVKAGDVVLIKPGEKIPVDGVISKGQGSVNQAPVTGESMPIEKFTGSQVFAGTILEVGALQVKAHKVGKDTTLAKVVELIEEAESAKAPVQKIADRFSFYFTPVVLSIAFLTILLTHNIISAIAVIVVACPCAIALATPLAVVASSGKAAKRGIIVKGGKYFEALAQVNTLVMDKTGTLTVGEPQVTDIKSFCQYDENEILKLAAVAEKFSEHALARAILKKAHEKGLGIPEPAEFKVIPGKGVVVNYKRQKIFLGNKLLFVEAGIEIPREAEEYLISQEKEAKTAILVGLDKAVCGAISVADVVKSTTQEAINELKRLGLKQLIMLTGDNKLAAQSIANSLGIKKFYAELLPEEKMEKIKEMLKDGHKIAMVGDGINDAPALALANVGIAMGAVGSDIAIEAADVVLMQDDWRQIAEAIKISRSTFRTIWQNLVFSMSFNIIGVSLAALGFLNPMLAAVAHVMPDFLVFLNSSRLLAWKS